MISFSPSLWKLHSRLTRLGPHTFGRSVILKSSYQETDVIDQGLRLLKLKSSTKMSVTSYITQYNELKQIKEYGSDLETPITSSMELGERLHKQLENLVVQDPVPRKTSASLDLNELELDRDTEHLLQFVDKIISLGRSTTSKFGVVRELPMRAVAPFTGCQLRGVIDCAFVSKDGIVLLETKRTQRMSPALMRLAYHQVLTYHWMFGELLCRKPGELIQWIKNMFFSDQTPDIAADYLVERSDELKLALETLTKLGLAPYVELQILQPVNGNNQYKEELYELQYDENILMNQLRSRADLFTGVRKPYQFDLRELNNTSATTDQAVVAITDQQFDIDTLTQSQYEALKI